MREPLLTDQDILARLNFIRNKKQEYFICFSLDSGQRVITRRTVTIGLLDVVLAHPREVFSGPLKDRAASIIVAHNHPSGDVAPSKTDIQVTQQLVAAGQLIGIRLYDHIIVATRGYYSFRSSYLIVD
jgi:DNA repair protein RadC